MIDERQTYAWNWFALHAAQRMQLVNFWLVAVAFLGTAFVQASVHGMTAVATGVCAAGTAASVAFLLLDVRTRALVQIAERALATLEREMSPSGARTEFRLVGNADAERSGPLNSYYVVIRGLESTIAVLFFAAAIHSLVH
jgi:hypothetical protein